MLRVCLVLACVVGCGGSQADKKEPQTAKQKQLQEARAKGEVDKSNSKWGGWRYTGNRDDCFYVIGRKCFKTKDDACNTCKKGAKCEVVGGGPATVTCKVAAK